MHTNTASEEMYSSFPFQEYPHHSPNFSIHFHGLWGKMQTWNTVFWDSWTEWLDIPSMLEATWAPPCPPVLALTGNMKGFLCTVIISAASRYSRKSATWLLGLCGSGTVQSFTSSRQCGGKKKKGGGKKIRRCFCVHNCLSVSVREEYFIRILVASYCTWAKKSYPLS